MTTFKKGMEYKLIRRNGDIAVRTFIVLGRNNTNMKIQISILGKVIVCDLKVDELQKCEVISLGYEFPMYENPYATDRI